MEFVRITSEAHPLFEHAMKLYAVSFPVHEQREDTSQREIMSCGDYHFTLIKEEDSLVGCILYWETDDFIYVEHFFIATQLRGNRYGQHALEKLTAYQKPVILEIDPVVDEITRRRKGFYERCGFAANEYTHVHPPYHAEHHGHALVVMSSPEPISDALYERFQAYLCNTVMKNAICGGVRPCVE